MFWEKSKYLIPGNIKVTAGFCTRFGGEKELGFGRIIYPNQKHTDNILIAGENFADTDSDYICDASVTNVPAILLTVRTADCVPVLFFDGGNNAVGAAHCGWRGTIARLQLKTALKMRELYGTDLSALKAAIGPCISKCCYEVSEEFYGDFINVLGAEVKPFFGLKSGGKYMCDLKSINKFLLTRELKSENIEISGNCTCCEKDLFNSYRRDGETRGGQIAFIGIRG